MTIGWLQIIVVLAIIILVFGTKRLRTLGSDIGKALKGFKKEIKEDNDSDRNSWTFNYFSGFFVAAKPEKISKYLRDLMKSFIKIRSTFDNAKEDLEREFNYQELKQEVFNEKKMKEFDKEDE